MKPLSPTQQRAWGTFASHANWLSLHTLDLDRFAWFVVLCHRYRRTAWVDFRELVEPHVRPDDELLDDRATQLDSLYHFGRRLLVVSKHLDFLGWSDVTRELS